MMMEGNPAFAGSGGKGRRIDVRLGFGLYCLVTLLRALAIVVAPYVSPPCI